MLRIIASGLLIALSLGCAGVPENDPKVVDLTPLKEHVPPPQRLFILGQDLDALRGYYASDCCSTPDGTTAYLSLYRLREGADFGGLGYSPEGRLLKPEGSWGAGKVGAWQTVNEFNSQHIAIGLFIAENEVPDGLSRISQGEFDAEIDHLANFAKTVPGQVYLRVGYEFDGVWNSGQENPEKYVSAYRHIVDRLRQSGVSNVNFVWQASASIIDDIIEKRREDIALWYPGDDYVDWVALSWFLNPDLLPSVDSDYTPASSRALADEVTALARKHGKPVLIAEASPQGIDINENFKANITPILDGPSGKGKTDLSDDEIWSLYYAPLFAWMDDNKDVVRALAYINVDWDSQPMWGAPYDSGFWGDSRLETNPELASRFNVAIEKWRSEP